MPVLHPLLSQSSSISQTLDSLRDSPVALWIVGALLILFAFLLLKAATRFIIKTIGFVIVLAVGWLGWNWWNEQPERSLHDIRSEWFETIRHTDFSKESIQGLVSRSGDLLDEALALSQTKGRESAMEALDSVSEALDRKIRDAASKGQTEARAHFEQIREEVRRRLAEYQEPEP